MKKMSGKRRSISIVRPDKSVSVSSYRAREPASERARFINELANNLCTSLLLLLLFLCRLLISLASIRRKLGEEEEDNDDHQLPTTHFSLDNRPSKTVQVRAFKIQVIKFEWISIISTATTVQFISLYLTSVLMAASWVELSRKAKMFLSIKTPCLNLLSILLMMIYSHWSALTTKMATWPLGVFRHLSFPFLLIYYLWLMIHAQWSALTTHPIWSW